MYTYTYICYYQSSLSTYLDAVFQGQSVPKCYHQSSICSLRLLAKVNPYLDAVAPTVIPTSPAISPMTPTASIRFGTALKLLVTKSTKINSKVKNCQEEGKRSRRILVDICYVRTTIHIGRRHIGI